MASLTKIGEGGLDLRYNSMGEEGWAAIIGAVCSSTVSKISTIDAASKGIGRAGAKLIAESLKTNVNASMTRLDVRWNRLGEEDMALLRQTIEGRLGFELVL